MYNISHIGNNIFLLQFDDQYDLALHFLRAQEFYESPNEKFRGQPFNIWDYIKWYSKQHNNAFTYPADWVGFNVPGEVLNKLYSYDLIDNTQYDDFMRGLLAFIKTQVGLSRFYVIGCKTGKQDDMEHEIAHALWYLNQKYKTQQQDNICSINSKKHHKFRSNLIKNGYTSEVLDDEIQASMATGIDEKIFGKEDLKMTKKFKEVFQEFYGKVKNESLL